jgi:hypothetical protein
MSTNVILWVLKESPIESCKHQNDSDVHHQSFPELVPEDQGIYSHDDGYHRHHVRQGNHRSRHCDLPGFCDLAFRSPAKDSSCAHLVAAGTPRALVNYKVWARYQAGCVQVCGTVGFCDSHRRESFVNSARLSNCHAKPESMRNTHADRSRVSGNPTRLAFRAVESGEMHGNPAVQDSVTVGRWGVGLTISLLIGFYWFPDDIVVNLLRWFCLLRFWRFGSGRCGRRSRFYLYRRCVGRGCNGWRRCNRG